MGAGKSSYAKGYNSLHMQKANNEVQTTLINFLIPGHNILQIGWARF